MGKFNLYTERTSRGLYYCKSDHVNPLFHLLNEFQSLLESNLKPYWLMILLYHEPIWSYLFCSLSTSVFMCHCFEQPVPVTHFSLSFLEHAKLMLTSEPLNLLLPGPGMLFPWTFVQFTPSQHSCLYPNITT